MERKRLGENGPAVSRLCFGTLTMSPLQANMTPRDGARLIARAYDLGVTFVDTADLYDTYPHIREAMKVARDLQVSSKAYCWDEKTAGEALERAYLGIGRDYIDVFMLHEMESIHTLRGHEEALIYLNKQKERGHVGAVGISTHYVACVEAAARFGGIDVIHPIINERGLGIADGTRDEMERAIEAAHARGIGILAMKPLGGGHLIASSKQAFDYVLEKPWIDSVAVGMQSIDEIEMNVAAFTGVTVDNEVTERLSKVKRKLLIQDWCEGCGKCAARCQQRALKVENGMARVDPEKCVLCGYCAPICPQFCIKVI